MHTGSLPPVTVMPHPLLEAGAFVTELDRPLGETRTPDALAQRLRLAGADDATIALPDDGAAGRASAPSAPIPLRADDAVRSAVRDLLRHGGFKPTGRSKPASEYLIRAVTEGALASINLAVDACNVASLHSGLPISVVDLDRAKAPFSLAIAPAGATYVFNASGQVIDVAGLLCLCDADGPCANAVKDAQRTKTNDATRRTLSIVWGTRSLPGRTARTVAWYRALLEEAGAKTFDAPLVAG